MSLPLHHTCNNIKKIILKTKATKTKARKSVCGVYMGHGLENCSIGNGAGIGYEVDGSMVLVDDTRSVVLPAFISTEQRLTYR